MANQIAWGFQTLVDRFREKATAVGMNVVWDAVQMSVAEHNKQVTALTSLFVKSAPSPKIRYKTPSLARLQPGEDLGRARPFRVSGYYDVGFPIQMGMAALGNTFIQEAKMTVEDANRHANALISADSRWMRDHILAALFANVAWTYDDPDDDIGTLTIEGLANGDAVKYNILSGADDGATDTHYQAQAAGIADATDPFAAIHDDLMEHPDNSGEVVAFIPTNLKADVKKLSGYLPARDPNIQTTSDTLVGNLGVSYPGDLFGYHDSKVWLVEWRSLPDNYIIATTTDGESPLGMREDDEAELRGFRQVAVREDHPFTETQWMRRAGFGGWNRVGAVVLRIGNASYAVPTNYSSPMP